MPSNNTNGYASRQSIVYNLSFPGGNFFWDGCVSIIEPNEEVQNENKNHI